MMPERKPDVVLNIYLSDKGFSGVVHMADTSVPTSGTFPDGHTYERLTGRLLGHLLAALREFEDEMRDYGTKNGTV
jgi:hypothetical protein